MKTHARKRIDIVIEHPLLERVLALLDGQGVSGYTVTPALAGRGQDGAWHRDGTVGRAGALVVVFCIINPDQVDAVLDPLFDLVERQIGIVTLSDVEVVRPKRF